MRSREPGPSKEFQQLAEIISRIQKDNPTWGLDAVMLAAKTTLTREPTNG